jgi:hypothetical protein
LLTNVDIRLSAGGAELKAQFTFPGYPIDRPDLSLRYNEVHSFLFEDLASRKTSANRFGRWIVDELVPTARGVRHRIEFEDGSFTIECFDLVAEWR